VCTAASAISLGMTGVKVEGESGVVLASC
jgi:hypothetical protein